MLNERYGVDHEKVMDIDLRIHSIFKEIKLIAEESLPPQRNVSTLATEVINLWSSFVLVFCRVGTAKCCIQVH